MARLYVADKETLDAVKADTTGILKQLQDADGKFSNIKRYGIKINKADSNPDTRITWSMLLWRQESLKNSQEASTQAQATIL